MSEGQIRTWAVTVLIVVLLIMVFTIASCAEGERTADDVYNPVRGEVSATEDHRVDTIEAGVMHDVLAVLGLPDMSYAEMNDMAERVCEAAGSTTDLFEFVSEADLVDEMLVDPAGTGAMVGAIGSVACEADINRLTEGY